VSRARVVAGSGDDQRMTRLGAIVTVLAVLAAPSVAEAEPERWLINPPNSAAHFTVKHLLITPIQGTFGQIRGEVWYDEAHPERSRVHAVIPTPSLHTGHPGRDQRLSDSDFFWSEAYPVMVFESTKVEQGPDGQLVVTGDLTLRGVTRSVVLQLEGPTRTVINSLGIPTRAVVGRTRLDRKDFGITWNKALDSGGMMVGDEVQIEIVLELVEPRPRTDDAP
jgi:polyisoprenoid-binding protein YceI